MMRGNLFEEENTQHRRKESLVRKLGVLLILLSLLIPGVHYYLNYQQIAELEEEEAALQEQKQSLFMEQRELEDLFSRREKLQELEEIEFSHYRLDTPLGELSRLIPEEVVFNRLNFTGDKINISGSSFYESSLLQFADRMDEAESFSLEELETEEQGDQYSFTMELALTTGEIIP